MADVMSVVMGRHSTTLLVMRIRSQPGCRDLTSSRFAFTQQRVPPPPIPHPPPPTFCARPDGYTHCTLPAAAYKSINTPLRAKAKADHLSRAITKSSANPTQSVPDGSACPPTQSISEGDVYPTPRMLGVDRPKQAASSRPSLLASERHSASQISTVSSKYPFPVTLHCIAEGLRRLRAVHAADDAAGTASTTSGRPPLGLKWSEVGTELPANGIELRSEALSKVLESNQTELTEHQWKKFGIDNLQIDHCVKAGDKYFQPAAPQETPTVLYRGMRGVALPSNFLLEGGTECAPMSTTSELDIACKYSASSSAVMLRFNADSFMQCGVCTESCLIGPVDYLLAWPCWC